MDISVVVCTYNRKGPLRNTLDSLIRQEHEDRFSFEIIVIDDGSTDGTEGVVNEVIRNNIAVPIRYVRTEGGGIAKARNRGLAEFRGEFIAFCDDDQLAGPQWLAELHKVAVRTGAACVGGSVLLDLPDSVDPALSPICLGLLEEVLLGEETVRYPENVGPGTGNIIIRRELLSRVGGFDASLRLGEEDTDFFYRAREVGADIWYAPKAVVRHMIPEFRLRDEYFKYVSLRRGISSARVRYKYKGRLRWLLALGRWVFRALARDVWLLLIAWILRDRFRELDRRYRLWMTLGYVRGSLSLLAPTIFRQRKFFDSLDFRSGAANRRGNMGGEERRYESARY